VIECNLRASRSFPFVSKVLKSNFIELANDYTIRRSAIDYNIPLITNARLASAFIYAFTRIKPEDISIKSWEEY
jgi:hypothetical protein